MKRLLRSSLARCWPLITVALLIAVMPQAGIAQQTIVVAVGEDIIADYQLFVGERDPLLIDFLILNANAFSR